jgi:hypothetical protein
LTYDLTPDAISLLLGISGNNLLPQAVFTSIDNQDRIMASCYANCGTEGVRTFELIPVPEPITLSLFLCGLGGSVALRKRKTRQK